MKSGIFYTETNFPTEEDFYDPKLRSFKEFFDLPLKYLKVDKEINFICIHSEVLSKGCHRLKIHRYVEEYDDLFHSFSRGICKSYIFITKINSFFDNLILNYDTNSMSNILSFIFVKFYSKEIRNAQEYFTNQKKIIDINEKETKNPQLFSQEFNENKIILKNKDSSLNNKDIEDDDYPNSDSSNLNLSKNIFKNELKVIGEEEIEKNFRKKIIKQKIENKIKIYLPIITEIRIIESSKNRVKFSIPFLNRPILMKKDENRNIETLDIINGVNLSCVILIFDNKERKFIFKNKIEVPEKDFNSNIKNFILFIDNLEENKFYLIKILFKINNLQSPSSPLFGIRTSTNNCEKNDIKGKTLLESNVIYSINESIFLKSFYNNTEAKTEIIKDKGMDNKLKRINIEDKINDIVLYENKIIILTKESKVLFFEENEILKNDKDYFHKNLVEKSEEKINDNYHKITEGQMINNTNDIYEIYNNFTNSFFFNNNNSKINFSNIPICKISLNHDVLLLLDVSGNLYSIGDNKFGCLGIFSEYSIKTNQLNKINFDENIFIYDISINNYSCFALGFVNGKQRFYSWGIGVGQDLDNSINLFYPEDKNSQTIFKKSNKPIRIKEEYVGKIVKIVSGVRESFLILKENLISKNIDDENFVSIYQSYGYVYTVKRITNFFFNYEESESPYKESKIIPLKFFHENFLSVLDVSVGQFNILFLVENLITKRKNIYASGFNNYGELCNIELMFIPLENPSMINFDGLDNILKIKLSQFYSFILCEKINKENNQKMKILYRIGSKKCIFTSKGNLKINSLTKNDLIFEFPIKNFDGKNILKIDNINDNVLLLVKEKLN